MDFITFLKTKREELGYSQNKFAKLAGITQSYFNSIERGEVRNPPSQDILDRITEALELNEKEKQHMLYLAAVERTPKVILDTLTELKKEIAKKDKNSMQDFFEDNKNAVPLFERISAGPGAFTDEDITDYIVLPGIRNTGKNIFAVNVVGDSMEPTIKDGSIIICKKGVELRNGDIGAFFVDEQAYVKRLKITKNYIALVSDNPNYAPIYIAPEEHFKVVGKVIKVLSDI